MFRSSVIKAHPYILGLTVAVTFFAPIPASSDVPAVSLTGAAVDALVKTYKSLGIGSAQDAPLLLQSDMVILSQFGPNFIVRIGKPATRDYRTVVTDGVSGAVLQSLPPGVNPFNGAIPLPGFIAGEIIAAQVHASSDSSLTDQELAVLHYGSYYLRFDSSFDSALVAFVALREAPKAMSAAPTLRPSATCVSTLCPDQLGLYDIRVFDGKVAIERKW